MTALLDLAHDIADDLSLDRPLSLFPAHDDGDSTGRRLKRAIERTCQYLLTNTDWQQCKREHVFQSQAATVQPGAIPADFLRFVPDTFWDQSQRIQLCMAEDAQTWGGLQSYPSSNYPPRWVRRGNDILIHPEWTVSRMRYEYISNAICVEPATPHDVEHTTDGVTLTAGRRYVVADGHRIRIPVLAPHEHIELVSDGGPWGTSGTLFETINGEPIISECPANFSDWISIVRQGGRYVVKPQAGAWAVPGIPTTNGMMLEAGQRYLIRKGHVLYLPVLPNGEQIEVYPLTGSWGSVSARFISRNGLQIGAPIADVGLATITMDHTTDPQYVIRVPGTTLETWGAGRRKPRFSTDRDEPLWDDELIRLGAIWNMQYRDGNQYNEDFRAFERRMYDVLKGSEGYGKISMRGGGAGGDRIESLRDRGRAMAMSQRPHTWGEFKP